jgi:hypothetical protein
MSVLLIENLFLNLLNDFHEHMLFFMANIFYNEFYTYR